MGLRVRERKRKPSIYVRYKHPPVNKDIWSYVSKFMPENDGRVLYWNTRSNVHKLPGYIKSYQGLADTTLVNDHRRINKYFEMVNCSLKKGDYFVVFLQAITERKKQVMKGLPPFLAHIRYSVDFMLHRVLPKLETTKRFYFEMTKGRNRAVSLTECMGRLASCGFEIIHYKLIDGKTCIITKKTAPPFYDMQPSYGMICSLTRVGGKGQLIKVYKLRTMHPYSEYLQEFMYKRNSLRKGGKIKNDIRITNWGRWFRKFWIDEIPMLIHLLKGEIKIVGVRPISCQYYNLYPKEVQVLRKKVLPGLIPPFYRDMPETFEEIVESEKKYIERFLEKPVRTDFYYFLWALYNILIKRRRSN